MKRLLFLWFLFSPGLIYAADVSVPNMTVDGTPTSDDLVYCVNDPAGTPVDRKCTVGTLIKGMLHDHTTATTGGVLTQFPLVFLNAGVPGATACTTQRELWVDTTNDELYHCPNGAGTQPVTVHSKSAAVTLYQGDSGTAAPASGGSTLNLIGGVGLTTTCADGSPDACTTDINNHVKSVWFGAGALDGDGAQCPATATTVALVAGGPRIPTFICTDNDGSTLEGSIRMPDSWNGGTVTFTHVYVQTAANTGALNGDIACQAKSNGEAPVTWVGVTEYAIDDAAVVGSGSSDQTTSAAVTCAGTGLAGGDMLFFRYQLDATGTTTTIASLHHIGFNMEYTVVGAGSD